MGKDEVTVKKRRKITTAATPAPETVKAPVVDIYKCVVDFEETEAQLRSAEKDATLFRNFCQNIRNLFSEIAEQKTKNTDEARQIIHEKRVEASLLIVALKKLNRLEKVRTKVGRDALHKEKQRVDSTHLLLQNLLYEADHLNKEVNKCLQFKSKDEEIDLVPVDEFYKEAPLEVSRPPVTKEDDHQLRLARLEWELRQRRELSAACSALVSSKQRASAATAAARARLDAVAPRLRDVLASTTPLQECLSLPLNERRETARAAALLPQPLFLLHANASAYSEAFGAGMLTVSISGDQDEARRLEQVLVTDSTGTDAGSNDSDSDQDNDNNDENGNGGGKKKRHHRTGAKLTRDQRNQQKKQEILKKYPLTLQLTVKVKDCTSLTLLFTYLVKLKIVTVKTVMSLPKPVIGVSAADVLNGDNILHELFSGDTGDDSPHPATAFFLKSAGVQGDFSQFISELGHPYVWAQRMCGLDFMSLTVEEPSKSVVDKPCAVLSGASVENVLMSLKRRLNARIGLMRELQDLESGKISPVLGAGNLPVRLSGSLTQWQSISWPEYSQALSTSSLLADEVVTQHDLLYRAIITRQSAKLVALVAIKSEYPKKSPIFSLTLHWNGTHHGGTDDDIRDIERCVNTQWGNTDAIKISLSTQITKLLTCLDVLLEAIGCSEFPPDKVMFRPVRSRNRIKPYKYLKQGTGVFTQY